jgi:hypothetical protein
MSFLPDSFGYWIGFALLVFWFVGACNRLVRLRSAALQAYATLDAALVSQLDFVRARATQETAGDMSGEGADPGGTGKVAPSAYVMLGATTAQLAGLLAVTRARPLDPETMAALDTALHVMLTVWQGLHPEAVIRFDADGLLSRPQPLSATPSTTTSGPRSGRWAERVREPEDPRDAEAEASLAWPEPTPAAL